jgi:glycosyltransferase involved in cell wall biosynthesis
MKIGISLLSARPQRTGVENAAFNLITRIGAMDTEDEYVVYADARNLPWLSDVPGRIRIVDVKLSSKRSLWTWEHLFFLTSQRHKDVDVIHFPIGGGVVGYGGKFVLTIHDIKHYSNKDLVKLRRHLLWRVWLKANLHRASRIITVSDHVKNDILREFPIESDRIRVIPNGVDRRFRPTTDAQGFRARYQFPERYVLFVGQTQTNKNLKRAIDAVALARAKHNLDHQFIIAGMPSEDDTKLKNYVRDRNLANMVRFIGYVDDDDLPNLYSSAELFLFPSLTEGFGIPPLEAMSCGVPVVAAHASCLPEVLGDAAIWVDPLSIESIADGIATGLLDETAKRLAIAKGLSRAQHFSWEKMALETVSVYRAVAGHPHLPHGAWNSGVPATAYERFES